MNFIVDLVLALGFAGAVIAVVALWTHIEGIREREHRNDGPANDSGDRP